jgi:YidC/Oxa1 family membrane protein insertase
VDKKNTFVGIALLIAAVVLFVYGQKHSLQPPSPAEIRHEVTTQVASEQSAPAPAPLPSGLEPAFATAQAEHAGASVTRLGNSFVAVTFTDFGGAIREVALKKYPAAQGRPDPFIFNELHSDPMLAFVGMPGMDRATRYSLVSKSDSEIVYRTVVDGRIEVTRHYTLSPDKSATTDPYLIRCETTLRNLTAKAVAPMHVALSIGTAAPSNALDNGIQLTTEYSNGSDTTLVRRASLEASNGFLGIGAHDLKPEVTGSGPVVWATVKNQFFASILTPDQPAASLETRRVKLLDKLPDADPHAYGITGVVAFNVSTLPPMGMSTLAGSIYVGPKEYPRLSNADVFKNDQDRVMDFGNFISRFCAAILITVMTWMHSWTLNWGVAIILTTLSLKLLFLPLSLTASRSAKRMQKIQPEMKVIKEKFKDNPQKQQAATMELFKKHKVNPLGGCLPMLIQLPFFFAFFNMLRSVSELRFAHFLWAHDLSAPDTVYTFTAPLIGSLNINILPLIVVATIAMQMRMTPQPTVDNAQMKMMKFMPFFMLLIYYSYSCALSLYSTINSLFTIGQQVVINRMKDVEDVPPAAGKGRPTKNVTPKRS